MLKQFSMTLQEYTIEELKAELKRRHDLAKAEKAKIKRCRMCKHWGEINVWGIHTTADSPFGKRRCCKFFKYKTGYYYISHSPSQHACEHFEEKEI